MAERGGRGRRGGQRGKTTKAAVSTKPADMYGKKLVVYKKLKELINPVMDNFGLAATEEVVGRMEATIIEFNNEVASLFTELVGQSKENHAHLKSLLTQEEGSETEPELDEAAFEGMSDIEKRLEGMEGDTEETETED